MNYHYGTAELIQWTAALDLNLSELLPEFGFPTTEDIAIYFEAKERARQAEAERRRLEDTSVRQAANVTINGPVKSVNQGNSSVHQTFNAGASSADLAAILDALRQVSQDCTVPEAERRALEVIVEQVGKNAEKPAVQGNWLQTARDTLQAVASIPTAVAAARLIAAFMGSHV